MLPLSDLGAIITFCSQVAAPPVRREALADLAAGEKRKLLIVLIIN